MKIICSAYGNKFYKTIQYFIFLENTFLNLINEKKYRFDVDIRFFIGFLFFKDFTDSLIVFYIDFHVKESPAQVESNVEKKN